MAQNINLHEDLRRETTVTLGSNRNFGLVFAAVFGLLGFVPLLKDHPVKLWAVSLSGGFLLLAFLAPRVLEPLKVLWAKLGLMLSLIVAPLALGILFFLVFVPLGFLLRRMGKTAMRQGYDARAVSYWIVRHPPGPDPQTMRRQF